MKYMVQDGQVVEAIQFLATQASFDAIMNLGVHHSQWKAGPMDEDCFYIEELYAGYRKVGNGDWVVKDEGGRFWTIPNAVFERVCKPVECV